MPPTCSVAVLWIGIGQVFSKCSGCSVETQVQDFTLSYFAQLLLSNIAKWLTNISQDSLHLNRLSELFLSKALFTASRLHHHSTLWEELLMSWIHTRYLPSLNTVIGWSWLKSGREKEWKLSISYFYSLLKYWNGNELTFIWRFSNFNNHFNCFHILSVVSGSICLIYQYDWFM